MTTDRKIVLYISMSLDGYIATKDNDLSFLSMVEQEGEDYGYGKFTESVDTVIIGRKTYDKVLDMGYEYPHTNKKVYIISRTTKPSVGSFEHYSGSLTELVSKLKSQLGKNVYCDGGAEIVNELQKNHLIDEYIISIIPILLGDGIRLFKAGRPEQKLILTGSKSYENGLIQLHYKA
ncbi:MAG: dihydrofolate reductase [Bacteroidales bacterium]|nr:dihydrofolate reductase [Bacteroidales bacterium]